VGREIETLDSGWTLPLSIGLHQDNPRPVASQHSNRATYPPANDSRVYRRSFSGWKGSRWYGTDFTQRSRLV